MKFVSALIAFASVAEAARYKSGAVTGYEKFTYGKFITRMKAPDKKGTVSSFFTYWNGPDFYPGGWNEMDVEIVPSVSENPFSMNIIYGDGHKKHETHDYQSNFDPKNDWHIYEMKWTPDYIAWSIDNKEVRRVPKDDPSIEKMQKGQSVMMNFWTPTFESWGKDFTAKDMPWYLLFDYVETYTYNSETKGFDFHWRDEFITFDSNRWHKSDNTTFDANSTTFKASQSYVDSGHLVLKMEPDEPIKWHPGLEHEPTSLEPVQGQPTYEHTGMKGDKPKKSDKHYDVLEEQHHSHEVHSHGSYGREHAPYYAPHGVYGERPYYAGGLYEHERREPYGYGDSYTHHYPYATDVHHEEEMGLEAPDAHLTYQSYHEPKEHAKYHLPEHKEEKHVVEAHHEPVHAVVTPHHEAVLHEEPHHSSDPAYYDQMFGGHMDGIPESILTESEYPSHTRRHRDDWEHGYRQEAHHPEVEVVGVRDNLSVAGAPEIGGLDETPYEAGHGDYEARFIEHDVVPHHEIAHEEHGLSHHMPTVPSYEELLWAYQHGGFHRGDAEGEIHHEDIRAERDGHHESRHYDEYPLYEPHYAEREYTLDHGEEHPTRHHYAQDRYQDFRTEYEKPAYHESRHEENPEHHEGGAFWRGDHYDDHDKQDEDFRHDTTAHSYHPGDTYEHDVSHHGGTQIMHDIEHEYDQLFHEIEASTKHGVEHRDVYKTLPLHAHAGDHEVVRTEVHEADKHHKTTHAEVAKAAAHEYEAKVAEAAHHSDRRYTHELPVAGPEMYSWAIHDAPEHRSIAERYHREAAYHDPVIHGDHGSSEYHELDHEPFHGDYQHGDLHFEPFVKGGHARPHTEVKHDIAYPHTEGPHEGAHAVKAAPVDTKKATPAPAAKPAPKQATPAPAPKKAAAPAPTPKAKAATPQPAVAKKLLQ